MAKRAQGKLGFHVQLRINGLMCERKMSKLFEP